MKHWITNKISINVEEWILRILFIVLLPTLVISCSKQTTPLTLPEEDVSQFSQSGNVEMPDEWWTAFNDDALNLLIDTALAENFNMQSAWQRLMAAHALVDRESAAFFPTLDATVQGEIGKPRFDFQNQESLWLGLSSEYEIDLWGRIRSSIEAEEFRAKATYADYQTTALSLSAEITQTWYQLTEAVKQLELVEEQIQTNEKVLDLLKARFGGGQIRGVDILRQQQLLESTREQQLNSASRIEVLEHRLAILTGAVPQDKSFLSTATLPELPPLPETGIPIELIRRRPDIQNAYNLLLAADKDLASAISNQYPRLSISASLSTAADNVDNLFENWAYSVAGNLLAPVFYGGELKAEVDRNQAITQQRLFEYGQAVLVSFREVEDALIREQKQKEIIQSLNEQIQLSQQAYEQLRVEYFNGAANYLEVLSALDQEQQLRRDLLSAKLLQIEYRIALYRSLAGGFKTSRET